jgi:hypothetical protein
MSEDESQIPDENPRHNSSSEISLLKDGLTPS